MKKIVLAFNATFLFLLFTCIISCKRITEGINCFYTITVEISNCDEVIDRGMLVGSNDFSALISFSKIGEKYIGELSEIDLGEQTNNLNIPINQLTGLKDILSGGELKIPQSNKSLRYLTEDITDSTSDTSKFRQYKITIDYSSSLAQLPVL